MTKTGRNYSGDQADLARLPTERGAPKQTEPEINTRMHGEGVRSLVESPSEFHVHQLLSILRRRRFLIFAMAICGAMLAGAAALLVPPKYTARAQVVVEPDRTVSSEAGGTLVGGVNALAIDTEMTMLAARDHLRAVLASLILDPEVSQTGDDPQSSVSVIDENAANEKDAFSDLWQTATDLVAGIRTSIGQKSKFPTFDEFERTLRIDQERRSRVISVRYTSESAVQSAAIVNRVVELYVRNQTERLRQASQAELSELASRIGELERTLESAEATIRQKLTTQQDGTGGEQESGAQLRQLEREVAEHAQLYVSLLERQKQLRSQQGTRGASVSILSLAEPPERPSSANPKFFFFPAIILALIGGGVLAVIIERLDRTLRSEHQVQSSLGIPCVALVPKLDWKSCRRPQDHLLKQPFSPYAEAIRSISASMQFAASGQAPKVVLTSSSVRGEGRTTLATSLAAYAARLHSRVLLVDLDFRKAGVAQALGLKADKGILNVITSPHTFDDVIQHVPELGLDVLPMPSCAVDPMTVFASEALQNVLNEIRKRYDFVVIDGPPLLGFTESILLSSLVDTVLFVVKWGSTRRDIAENAIGELRAFGWSEQTVAERVRAVVTHVKLKQHARYHYGDSVELLIRRGSRNSRRQKMQPLAELSKADEKGGDSENISPVAAE